MIRLSIVQPYLPRYRVEFFERLVASLHSDGVACRVIAASPRGSQAARGDAATADWLVHAPAWEIPVPGGTLKVGRASAYFARSDAVIVGLVGTSLDTYRALLGRQRVGLWGHVDSFVRPWNALDRRLEQWQMRTADHVFAYTPRGARFARDAGVAAERITTVMNTVPTEEMEAALARLDDAQVASFRAQCGLGDAPALAFIGGLDAPKRIDFLAQTLDLVWPRRPDVRFLVAGQGTHAGLLDGARSRGQVIPFEHADADMKAKILRASGAVVSPGRIGLVAVDALVAGLPILTTAWPYHAPEAEYLHEGTSRFTSDDTVAAYAALIEQHVNAGPVHHQFSYPTMADMVRNFAGGVHRMLA